MENKLNTQGVSRNSFSGILFIIGKIFKKSILCWILLLAVSFISIFGYILTASGAIEYPESVNMYSWMIILYALLPVLTVLVVISPIIFTVINNSVLSDRIGSTQINERGFLFIYWSIFMMIGSIMWIVIYLFWTIMHIPFTDELGGNDFLLRVPQTLLFGILFVTLANTIGLFVGSLKINVIGKVLIMFIMMYFSFFINYAPDSGFWTYDEVYGGALYQILKWLWLIFNLFSVPFSLITLMLYDPLSIEWYIYLSVIIWMIFEILLLLFITDKIFSW